MITTLVWLSILKIITHNTFSLCYGYQDNTSPHHKEWSTGDVGDFKDLQKQTNKLNSNVMIDLRVNFANMYARRGSGKNYG